MKFIEKKKEVLLDDFVRVDRVVFQHEKFDGSLSNELVRINVDRGDSAAVLLINPEKETFIFAEQFRYSAYTKNADDGQLLEIVAGTVEKGESPEETIRREVKEEVGFVLKELKEIFSFYPSPGASNELIYLYFGEIFPQQSVSTGGGVISEGEDIRVVELPIDSAMQMLERGEIKDAKTIIALQWYRLNH